MSSTLNIFIAERNYPIRIKEGEEHLIVLAAKLLNEKIESIKSQYAGTDMQDFLAMSALMNLVDVMQSIGTDPGISEEISKIQDLLKKF